MTITDPMLAAAVLANQPDMTPARLRSLLDGYPSPLDALAHVETRLTAEAAIEMFTRRRTRVFVHGCDGYPIDEAISYAPRVLFGEGDCIDVLERPRVAIVGTRAATPHGLADAADLGAFLADAGVTVVSGMALGIDGAAHEGALRRNGGVVGVVATGLDITYPRRHTALHDNVRRHGLLLSEYPYRTEPNRGRFPVRNRIIAALADVVVVVEATAKGGARITAEHAMEYGRTVLAVPGSRRNLSATGCNELLRDGATPLLEPSDVLLALGLSPGCRRAWTAPKLPVIASPGLKRDERSVLKALGGEPAAPDQLAARLDTDLLQLSSVLDRLSRAGHITRDRGLIWPA